MTTPTPKEIGPILTGAGIFIISTYVAIHQFIYPRSEAEAAMMGLNKRIDSVEQIEEKHYQQYLTKVDAIYEYIRRK